MIILTQRDSHSGSDFAYFFFRPYLQVHGDSMDEGVIFRNENRGRGGKKKKEQDNVELRAADTFVVGYPMIPQFKLMT